ncbi:MAG: hypothetical protein KDD70_11140 [Bdellovibrionales bacterium]|nr:hypothetical protein [Bdellovibrionales bacterium]
MDSPDDDEKTATPEILDDDRVAPGLVDEADVQDSEDSNKDSFDIQLEQTLKETEEAVLTLDQVNSNPDATKLWLAAGEVVRDFKPVPWFIWRLSNFVLGRAGHIGEVSEGLVFGLRRLMFAVASDSVLGSGEKVNSVRKALSLVPSDVIAAAAVVHAICRRLAKKPHERIWKPILDDALLRAQIGFRVGRQCESFGGGRGMLAGFAGRAGLTVLIAGGDLDSARKALELLATGKTIKETGLLVYKCDPLQVSAMLLTASGIGRDAAFGTVSFAIDPDNPPLVSEEQKRWFATFQIVEFVRANEIARIPETSWEIVNCSDDDRSRIIDAAKIAVRRGHGWHWMQA